MKRLAVAPGDSKSCVAHTLDTVQDRTYPLFNQYYFYLNRDPGKPVDARVEEFLRFILSQEGQACVQREGRYLPLTAEVVNAQLKKLD